MPACTSAHQHLHGLHGASTAFPCQVISELTEMVKVCSCSLTQIHVFMQVVKKAKGWKRRWTIIGLCFVAFMLCNMDRVNMSIAIMPMAKQYGWDSAKVGIVQSSFFWYTLFMLFCRHAAPLSWHHSGLLHHCSNESAVHIVPDRERNAPNKVGTTHLYCESTPTSIAMAVQCLL